MAWGLEIELLEPVFGLGFFGEMKTLRSFAVRLPFKASNIEGDNIVDGHDDDDDTGDELVRRKCERKM